MCLKTVKGSRDASRALIMIAAEALGNGQSVLGLAVIGRLLLAYDTQGPGMLKTVQYPTQPHTMKYRPTPNVIPIMNIYLLPISHLTDEEIEAQRGRVTCPRQHSQKRHKAGGQNAGRFTVALES